jgi:hypothetical protein
MNEPRYQLVIQFKMDDDDDALRDEVLALEDDLIERLDPGLVDVDGHDAGSGEMNLFLFTHEPAAAFAQIKPIMVARSLLDRSTAAYRPTDGEDFVPIWPEGLREFEVV